MRGEWLAGGQAGWRAGQKVGYTSDTGQDVGQCQQMARVRPAFMSSGPAARMGRNATLQSPPYLDTLSPSKRATVQRTNAWSSRAHPKRVDIRLMWPTTNPLRSFIWSFALALALALPSPPALGRPERQALKAAAQVFVRLLY